MTNFMPPNLIFDDGDDSDFVVVTNDGDDNCDGDGNCDDFVDVTNDGDDNDGNCDDFVDVTKVGNVVVVVTNAIEVDVTKVGDVVVVTNAIEVNDDDDDDDNDVVVVTNAIEVIEAKPIIGSKTSFNESNYIVIDTVVEPKPMESMIKQIVGYAMGIFLLIIMTINVFIVLYKLYEFLYTMSIFWNIIILLCSISIGIFATVRLCNVIKEQIQNYVNQLLDMCNPLNIVKKWCKLQFS